MNPLSSHQLATIDIGSNAVRMVYGVLLPSYEIQIHKRWRSHLRLGESVFTEEKIAESAVQQLLQVLHNFSSYLPLQTYVYLIATSAFREAKNQKEVCSFIHQQLHWEVNILSGVEEAACIFNVLQHYLPSHQDWVWMFDLGGGSCEISCLQKKQLVMQQSFRLGILRQHVTQQDNIYRQELERLLQEIKNLVEKIPKKQRNRVALILTGGGAKLLGRLLQSLHHSPKIVIDSEVLQIPWLLFQETLSQTMLLSSLTLGNMFRPHQLESISAAISLFLPIGEILCPQIVLIPLVGLKEAKLLQVGEEISSAPCKILPSSHILSEEVDNTYVKSFLHKDFQTQIS